MLLPKLPKKIYTVFADGEPQLIYTVREEARNYKRKLQDNGYNAQIFTHDVQPEPTARVS